MPILISKCFERVSQESAEEGEAEERGFKFEDETFSFRDLLSEMKKYVETSSYPCRSSDWLISYPDHDYRTGEEITYSLHFSNNNKSRMDKYWEKALRYRGFLK
jgi:hypothetical protein